MQLPITQIMNNFLCGCREIIIITSRRARSHINQDAVSTSEYFNPNLLGGSRLCGIYEIDIFSLSLYLQWANCTKASSEYFWTVTYDFGTCRRWYPLPIKGDSLFSPWWFFSIYFCPRPCEGLYIPSVETRLVQVLQTNSCTTLLLPSTLAATMSFSRL